ncbi:unnamed protein product [Caenorhabditis angaria]|uniref:Uncharacterized protein n=1 Tax=Caenorhabditis angaria TaxID=860376 RepID=A0A9P1MZG8_9PELO|nr:unnamed protein product [Caenorhabditis angaria]
MMRCSIVIILIYAFIITVNAQHQYNNPTCPTHQQNPKLKDVYVPRTLLIFAIGYDAPDADREKMTFVVRQTACFIPTHDNITSAAYFLHNSLFDADKDARDTLSTMAQYSKLTDQVSCDKFGEGLKELKNEQALKNYERFKVIGHMRKIADDCDYALQWNNAQLDSKFEFFMIRFDNKKDPGIISLNYENIASIDPSQTSPSAELKNVTGTFMNYVLGAETPPQPPAAKPKKKPIPITPIAIAVFAILFVIFCVGFVGLSYWKKWCCFKKKQDSKPIVAKTSTPAPPPQPAPPISPAAKAGEADDSTYRTYSECSMGTIGTEGRDDLGEEYKADYKKPVHKKLTPN